MSTCPQRDELNSFLNRAFGANHGDIEKHISGCVDCQQMIDDLRRSVEPVPRELSAENEGALAATLDDLPATLTDTSAVRQGPTPRNPILPGYEILEELGRGGMGIVYKARQLSLNRLVALKLIMRSASLGDTKQLARFNMEAELLAQLQHPNIVQVFETGQYQDMPYLSMEYLPGVTLAREMESNRFSPQQAAALVEKLARAMFSAHQRGVLHRDLKPSNVLFTADKEPKITDFGLAKRVGDESHLTVDQTVLGTPSYMPPEQAQGRIAAIGPQSDVYSLGAILYELLTGRPPFRGSSALETIKQVIDREPLSPRTVNNRIPRDIETICLKCLHKQPESRFETAADLADDLQRFQRHEPILARRIGMVGRGWRWCRRNPALSSAMSLTVLAVLSGIVGVAWQSRQVKHARAQAQQQFQRYQAESSEKLNLIQDLMERVPEDQRAQDQRLQSAVAAYEEWLADEPSNTSARASYAEALFRVAEIRRRIGQFDLAEEMFLKARNRYEQLMVASPPGSGHAQKLAVTLTSLGETYRENGKLQNAIDAYGDSLRYQSNIATQSTFDSVHNANMARTLYCRALALRGLNRTSDAEQDLRQSIELLESSPDLPTDGAVRQGLARSRTNLGILLRGTARPNDAHREYLAAIELYAGLEKQYPQVADHRFELATTFMNLANLLLADASRKELGIADPVHEAESNYRTAIDKLRTLVTHYGNVASYRKELANSLNGLGAVLAKRNQPEQAERAWIEAIEEIKRLVARSPEVAEYHDLLAQTTYNRDYLQRHNSQAMQHDELLREAIDAQGRAVTLSPTNVLYSRRLKLYERTLSRVLVDRGKHQEAAEIAQQLAGHAAGDPPFLYSAAELLAQCAVLAQQDSSLDADRINELTHRYRAKASELVATCRKEGLPIKPDDFPGIE